MNLDRYPDAFGDLGFGPAGCTTTGKIANIRTVTRLTSLADQRYLTRFGWMNEMRSRTLTLNDTTRIPSLCVFKGNC